MTMTIMMIFNMIMMMTMKWFGAVPIIIKSKLPAPAATLVHIALHLISAAIHYCTLELCTIASGGNYCTIVLCQTG